MVARPLAPVLGKHGRSSLHDQSETEPDVCIKLIPDKANSTISIECRASFPQALDKIRYEPSNDPDKIMAVPDVLAMIVPGKTNSTSCRGFEHRYDQVFFSESVNEGQPDELCDRVSVAVLEGTLDVFARASLLTPRAELLARLRQGSHGAGRR